MTDELILHKILRELCEENSIKLEDIPNTNVYKLSKDGHSHFIHGNYFWQNNLPAGHIADLKHLTYAVLNHAQIPAIEHQVLLNPLGADDPDLAQSENEKTIEQLTSENSQVVVKANNDSRGVGVYLCSNKEDVNQQLKKIFSYTKSASICPFYHFVSEYRCFFLNGEVLLIYGKTKPHVIGDGKRSVKELLEDLNLPDTPTVAEELKTIDLDYVPKNGEVFELSWKHNLSGGATAKVVAKGSELYAKLEKLAISAGKAIDINFATIDIADTAEKGLAVIEINYGVCMEHFIRTMPNGYEVAKSIYEKALLEL